MELTHQFTVPASIEQTWIAFNDLERIAPCFPGATLTSVEGDEFTGTVKVKLGPISLQYNGTGQFVERDESAYRALIEAKGKDKRGNGTASAKISAQLTEAADGTTVEVHTDLNITGKPAQFGRGVIQDVSDKLLSQFVDCIASKLKGDGDTTASGMAAAEEAASPGAGPTATATTPPQDEPGASAEADNAQVNLVAAAAPVLLRRAAPYAIGALVVFVLYKLIRRR